MSSVQHVPWRRFGEQSRRSFARHGYLFIEEFAPPDVCADLTRAILAYARRVPIKEVRWERSTFDTFNGSQVDDSFPALRELYDHFLHDEIALLCSNPIATVDDRRVGISINLTRTNGKFQPHFDRHVMTAILYVNEDFDGGEMVFYPRMRFWLGHPSGIVKRKLQRWLDRLVRSSWYLRLVPKKVTVKPRTGCLLVFEGTRTYHAVSPVNGSHTRVSLQFAFDKPGMAFDVSGYYGK